MRTCDWSNYDKVIKVISFLERPASKLLLNALQEAEQPLNFNQILRNYKHPSVVKISLSLLEGKELGIIEYLQTDQRGERVYRLSPRGKDILHKYQNFAKLI